MACLKLHFIQKIHFLFVLCTKRHTHKQKENVFNKIKIREKRKGKLKFKHQPVSWVALFGQILNMSIQITHTSNVYTEPTYKHILYTNIVQQT